MPTINKSMDTKKSEKANLENKKSLFIQIVLIFALVVPLSAFGWTTGQRGASAFDGILEEANEEEQIHVTGEQPPEEIAPSEMSVTDLFEIVETNGNVSNINITRSVDALLDEAAKEAVAASPKWEPGMQRGRPVRVRYSIPIIFQLQ